MAAWRLGLGCGLLLACGTLLDLDDDPGPDGSSSGSGADDDDASMESSSGRAGSSSSSSSGAGTSSGGVSSGGIPSTYAAAQLALAELRQQGPLTSQGSRGQCTDNYFVWRDSDGTLHSWSGLDGSVLDYAFVAGPRPYFRASDAYVAVDTSPTGSIQVYRTNAANELVTTLPLAYSWSATNDGIVQIETSSGTTQRIRKWTPGGANDYLTSTFTTQQPPAAFGHGQLVVPADVTVPYPLYLIDVSTGAIGSVVFDAALAFRFAEPSPRGLFVSYARNGGTTALRWYRDDQDGTRLELGDEIDNLPPYFSDGPANEHQFLAHMAFAGERTLFYDGFYGVWAYDLDAGSIRPVQLGADQKTLVPDTLCVLPGPNLLVYRDAQDPTGRVWSVPIADLPD